VRYLPGTTVRLLAAIIAIDRGHIDRRSAAGRTLSLVLLAVLVADAAGVTGRLIADLIQGGPETKVAADLLKTGFLVWLYTIIAFAFVYWTLDGGGPESRFPAPLEFPNFAFPAQLNPGIARPGWRPEFFDYLYLGFTDATAFSPTDVMPLARWGKLAMTVQAVCSLMILGLVIAGGQYLEIAARQTDTRQLLGPPALRLGPGRGGAGVADGPQDRTAQPMASQQGQFDLQAVLPDGTAQGLLGFAHPVLDRVLVQQEMFGRRFVATVLL
jgi:hypothetical protein